MTAQHSVVGKVSEGDLGALCYIATGLFFFHAGWKMHRLDRRTQAGESGVYPFPFSHAFVVLMFINSMHGLRVEGVCVCG